MPSPLEHSEQAVLLESTRVSDGMGGYSIEYRKTLEFDSLITLDSSIEMRQAERAGVLDNYTIYVAKDFPIESGDYFFRKSDEAVFRVTSSPNEQKTPEISGMDFKVFTAQKTVLPIA